MGGLLPFPFNGRFHVRPQRLADRAAHGRFFQHGTEGVAAFQGHYGLQLNLFNPLGGFHRARQNAHAFQVHALSGRDHGNQAHHAGGERGTEHHAGGGEFCAAFKRGGQVRGKSDVGGNVGGFTAELPDVLRLGGVMSISHRSVTAEPWIGFT